MGRKQTKITLKWLLAWVFGAIFLAMSASDFITGSIVPAISEVAAASLLLPPIIGQIQSKTGIEISTGVKIVLIILLISIAAGTEKVTPVYTPPEASPQQNSPSVQNNQQVATTKQVERPKIKKATIEILKVNVQLADLEAIRVRVNNTGNVGISPKFDYTIKDSNGNVISSGSPMLDDIDYVSPGKSKTGELSVIEMFRKDGQYTLIVDLLDENYNKLSSATTTFTVNYWSKFT